MNTVELLVNTARYDAERSSEFLTHVDALAALLSDLSDHERRAVALDMICMFPRKEPMRVVIQNALDEALSDAEEVGEEQLAMFGEEAHVD